MFAPEGYLSLDEIFLILGDIAMDWRLGAPHPNDPTPGGTFQDNPFLVEDENSNRSAAYQEWLFHSFLNRHESNLFASTASGRALKLSPSVVGRHRVYSGPFFDEPAVWNSIVEHLADPFDLVSKVGFRIDLQKGKTYPGFADFEPLLRSIDQLPVCWPLPREAGDIDWKSVCGISDYSDGRDLNLSPKSVSQAILQVWRDDSRLRKKEIKERVAPTLSHREFAFAWRMAAVEEPDIVKPGRKKS